MSQPVVSIVMAAFNEAKYIAEAIESILKQSYENFEFIIINDGSVDNTAEIIDSYKDPRIKHIKNETNLKLIASLNKGLAAAKGKYIARMDADDISVPGRLQKQVDFMESHPEIGICGAQLTVFGNMTGAMNYPLEHKDILLYMLITSPFGNNVVIFRKEVLDQHALFFTEGYYHSEDYKSWTNWLKVTKGHNLDEYLVRYRSHSKSVSVSNRFAQRQTRNRVRREYAESVFHLSPADAECLFGKLSAKRMSAIKTVLTINRTKNIFEPAALKDTLMKVWYLDALESTETGIGSIFRFPLIFTISFKTNFIKWIFVIKHYLKTKFSYHG
jgi:glycosyltransferase involved in cell wall biosynthesis